MTLQIARLVAVVALLCAAAALATPKGRLPLSLRGVLKVMRADRGECAARAATEGGEERVPAWRRLVAFMMVVCAVVLAMI